MMKRLMVLISIVSIIAWPTPVKADGGPMVDPLLFAKLKEGQQVAVIKILNANTASVDLFVSILDQTGQSHEITYFVPLGTKASEFKTKDENSFDFNRAQTNSLDSVLFQDYRNVQGIIQMLFAGALLTNGIWLTPFWFPMLVTGCASSPPAPVSTFKTDSSVVSVYAIDQTTDIEALISSTGLDPSVKEALKRVSGQQIAVVRLRTQPQATTSSSTSINDTPQGDPGLYLSWVTSFVPGKEGSVYRYPLGTGASWAHPIDMTRVYVVAPLNVDVSINYPRLGADLSGFSKTQHGTYEPKIISTGASLSYAVNDAINPSYPTGTYTWRATYANSNASDDIVITVNQGSKQSLAVRLRLGGSGWALGVGIFFAVLPPHQSLSTLFPR